MIVEVRYIYESDDYEFRIRETFHNKWNAFRINADSLQAFAGAVNAAANHQGVPEQWKACFSIEQGDYPLEEEEA